MSYDLKTYRMPGLTGRGLGLSVSVLETDMARKILEPIVNSQLGMNEFRQHRYDIHPSFTPLHTNTSAVTATGAQRSVQLFMESVEEENLNQKSASLRGSLNCATLAYARDYRSELRSPLTVSLQLQAALESPHMQDSKAFVFTDSQALKHQAELSTKRFMAVQPRGLLEGVPVAIKDSINAVPYATTGGTEVFGQDHSAEKDATVVSRLRAAGAMVLGKTNMHEIGIGVTGANPHYGHCLNPWDTDFLAGGSSGGSAAAVASGICPVAIGSDGGGSVRIPAAFCGVVGLKPTWGRISSAGTLSVCDTVDHLGPIGASVDDVALAYATIAGPDPLYGPSCHQPFPHLSNYFKADLTGLKIGIYKPWFDHADKAIVAACREAVKVLESLGAEIVPVIIEGLEDMRLAHAVTIMTEMLSSVEQPHRETPERFNDDTRMLLAFARLFRSTDYVKAQRVRTRAIAQHEALYAKVDMLVTPATGALPPRRPKGSKVALDLGQMTEIMRFSINDNLVGMPAITLPVKLSGDGLPIGLQLHAGPWQEHVLLRTARSLESALRFNATHRPPHFFDFA
ncbi:amidase [Allohahella marinimesophila]|uniref:Amidase n=1 Tax=Allohahella marinimesophila TaxID=1054972 RepID=A0ABP7NGW3_9GAMM